MRRKGVMFQAEQLVLFYPGETDLDSSVRKMSDQGFTIHEFKTLQEFLKAKNTLAFEFAVITYLSQDKESSARMEVTDAKGKIQTVG